MGKRPLKNKVVIMNDEDLYSRFENKNFTYSDVKSALDWLELQIDSITTAEGFRIKMREAFPDIYGSKR